MRYLTSIISYGALKTNMAGLAKATLQYGLTGKVTEKEPVFSMFLRKSEHFYLIEQIEEFKINKKYKAYLQALVLKHERNYSDAWKKVRNIADPELLSFKIKLLYDMKNLKELIKLINSGEDILYNLTDEQKYNLIKYLTASNHYVEAEKMIENTMGQQAELIEVLEEEKNDTYMKYTWQLYKKKVLGLHKELTEENFFDFLIAIDVQQRQLKNTGYILLANYFYEEENIVSLLNKYVVGYIEKQDDILNYVDLEALHTLNFKLDDLSDRDLELQKLLNYYDMGQRSKTIIKSIINLIPDARINRQHIMYIRLMLLDEYISLKDDDFINLIKHDRRVQAVFHSPKLFLSKNIHQKVDDFLHDYLSTRDRNRIYKNVSNQLTHSRAKTYLPTHFVHFLESNASFKLKYAYILSRYYFRNDKHIELEHLLNNFRLEKQLNIRLYLTKYLYYQKDYPAALNQTKEAQKLKSNHQDVLRNFIRNYHMMGVISKRYEYVKKMKDNFPHRLYKNEFEMASQEFELYASYWDLNEDILKKISESSFKLNERKILFILNKALPVINGYTVRSHEIIKRVREAGYDPVATTRMGWSPIQEGYSIPEVPIDGIRTYYINQTEKYPSNKTPLRTYFDEYAAEILEIIKKEKPSIIHAASNFQNAMPALVVGKALDIKTIYEVRGLWHYTQSTKNSTFYRSERFAMQENYEIECCKIADEVICISESLKKYLIEKGVPTEKIKVVPNGVDSEALLPMPKAEDIIERYNLKDKYVLGFIGSLTSYEGIELVYDAMFKIKENQRLTKEFAFLIVGDGPYKEELINKAKDLGFDNEIIFVGRVPREEVAKYYSVIDIAPFPRIDEPVCHLVTPIKTYEAMAMEKKVIVSDVGALAEMVEENVNGKFFKSENVEELADAIVDILTNETIGRQSREWVIQNREWKILMHTLLSAYE